MGWGVSQWAPATSSSSSSRRDNNASINQSINTSTDARGLNSSYSGRVPCSSYLLAYCRRSGCQFFLIIAQPWSICSVKFMTLMFSTNGNQRYSKSRNIDLCTSDL